MCEAGDWLCVGGGRAKGGATKKTGRARGDADASQLWLLDRAGGEAQQLTTIAEGVDDYAWSPDRARIVVVSQDADSAARADTTHLMPAAARGAEDALLAAEQRAAQAGEAGARAASEQELAAASKAMLRMAKRLAAAARPIANTIASRVSRLTL